MSQQLISVDELAEAIPKESSLRLLDVRWSLGGPDGRTEYALGHLPGAVFVDLPTQLAGHGLPADGRHPLPDIADLQAAARSWGLDDDADVVVYDDSSGQSAARAWWLLRHAGLSNVRVLDGGLAAWRAASQPISTDAVAPVPGTVTLAYGHLPVLDIDAAAALPEHGVLLDARAPERFSGETEPVDPVAGHIPGARNAPSAGNLADDGRFLPADDLAARYEALGVDGERPVGVYCGSGVTAAHDVLALMIAGMPAALYPGSWSAWSNHPGRPVATGSADAEATHDSTTTPSTSSSISNRK
ncbi:MAG: sulfurtransferase [Leifsonia sp.]